MRCPFWENRGVVARYHIILVGSAFGDPFSIQIHRSQGHTQAMRESHTPCVFRAAKGAAAAHGNIPPRLTAPPGSVGLLFSDRR